jgi:hypothetical protein
VVAADVVLLDDPRSDEAPPSSRRLVDLPMEDVVGGEVAPDGAAARAEAEEADKARRHAEQDARSRGPNSEHDCTVNHRNLKP